MIKLKRLLSRSGSPSRSSLFNHTPQSLILPTPSHDINSTNPQEEYHNKFCCFIISEAKSPDPSPLMMASHSSSLTSKSSSITTKSSLMMHSTDSDYIDWSSESETINCCGSDYQQSTELVTNDVIREAHSPINAKMEVNHKIKVKANSALFGKLFCAHRGLIQSIRQKQINHQMKRLKAKSDAAEQILTTIKAQLANQVWVNQIIHDEITEAELINQPTNNVITDKRVIDRPINDNINNAISNEDDIKSDLEDLVLRYLRLTNPDRSTALTFLQAFNPHLIHTVDHTFIHA